MVVAVARALREAVARREVESAGPLRQQRSDGLRRLDQLHGELRRIEGDESLVEHRPRHRRPGRLLASGSGSWQERCNQRTDTPKITALLRRTN